MNYKKYNTSFILFNIFMLNCFFFFSLKTLIRGNKEKIKLHFSVNHILDCSNKKYFNGSMYICIYVVNSE